MRQALDAIGYDTIDLGPLAEGWRTQRDTRRLRLDLREDPADWSRGARPLTASRRRRRAAGSPLPRA